MMTVGGEKEKDNSFFDRPFLDPNVFSILLNRKRKRAICFSKCRQSQNLNSGLKIRNITIKAFFRRGEIFLKFL